MVGNQRVISQPSLKSPDIDVFLACEKKFIYYNTILIDYNIHLSIILSCIDDCMAHSYALTYAKNNYRDCRTYIIHLEIRKPADASNKSQN